MELIHIAATFQFAVRALAFSPAGDRLAAAGDDPSISVVHVDIDDESSVPHTFNVGPNTRGLAWDPEGTYVAMAQTDGSLRVWDMSSRTEVWTDKCGCVVRARRAGLDATLRRVRTMLELLLMQPHNAARCNCKQALVCAAGRARRTGFPPSPAATACIATPACAQVNVDSPANLQLAWHPDGGKALSLPSSEAVGDAVVVDRLRWGRKPSARLNGVHTDAATQSFFSPNGARGVYERCCAALEGGLSPL